MNKKYVYIFTNTHSKDIVKIGRTDKYPEIRAEQLNKQTGTIGKYQVAWFKEVLNNEVAEKLIHFCLKDLNIGGEYFDISKEIAIKIADNVTNGLSDIITQQDEVLKKWLHVHVKANELTLRTLNLATKYNVEENLPERDEKEDNAKANIKKFSERLKKVTKV
jgi:hypothetical protein